MKLNSIELRQVKVLKYLGEWISAGKRTSEMKTRKVQNLLLILLAVFEDCIDGPAPMVN